MNASDSLVPSITNEISDEALRKLHLHLAHGSIPTLERVISNAGRTVNRGRLNKLINDCWCTENYHKVQRPLITSHIAEFPGHTVGIDVFQLNNTDRVGSLLMVVDGLTRFIIVCRLKSLSPTHVLHYIYVHWICYFGRIHTILLDQGPGLVGKEWENFAEAWGGETGVCADGIIKFKWIGGETNRSVQESNDEIDVNAPN